MHPRAFRHSLALILVLVAQLGAAQEVLEDQDPIDPDWAPAWDEPLWPAPAGAVLEIAGGHTGGRVPLPLDGSGLDGSGFNDSARRLAGDYVLALLTLPLGARLRPLAQTDSAGEKDDPAEDSVEAEAEESSPAPAKRSEPRAPTPPSAPVAPGLPPPTAAVTLPVPALPARASPRRMGEVPLALLQAALDQAEKAAGFGSELRSLGAIRKRSRLSGLAPELRLRGATGIDQTRSVDSAGPVPSDESWRDGSDSLLEIRLTFHLERLLHSGQEVALARVRQQLLAQRSELRREVGEELVSYVRARRRLELDSLDDEQRDRTELLSEQARLSLYLLTGGWFRGEATLLRYSERYSERQSDVPAARPQAHHVRGSPN